MAIEAIEPGTSLEFLPRYYYQFKSSNGLSLVVLRAEGIPKITDGRGGWEVVERRRRKGLTKWTGRNPLRMDVPIIFDGWYDPPFSVDKDIGVLNQMALGDNFVLPPTVKINGTLPVTGITWVIEDLNWGDNAIWIVGDDGDDIRVRQDCVVKLLQFVDEDVVVTKNAGQTPHTYLTQEGDTPRIIAKKKLGNAALWKAIRDANPGIIRDANQSLPAGLVINIPDIPHSK